MVCHAGVVELLLHQVCVRGLSTAMIVRFITCGTCGARMDVVSSSKNIPEIINESIGKLVMCSGFSAIRIPKISYSVFPSSLDCCLVEVGSVAISMFGPNFLCSL